MSARVFLSIALLSTVSLLAIQPAQAQAEPASCSPASDPAALALDTPASANDASAGSTGAALATDDCFFVLTLPDPASLVGKELHLTLSSSENHDLFVKRGAAAPLAAPYVCSTSATTAASESCRVFWPLTQSSYSIRVARIAAGAGDVTLTASIVNAPPSGCPNGYAITPLTLGAAQSVTLGTAAGSRCYFSFQPNAGDDIAKVVGTGLPSLLGSYVIARGADVPVPSTVPGTTSSSDLACAPLSGATRTCAAVAAPGEPWFAALVRGTAVTTATPFGITASSLKACSLGTGIIDVALDTPISGSVDGSVAGQSCKFRLPLTQPESLSRWSVTSNGANVDLYLRGDQPVATGAFDCGSAVSSTTGTDVCAVNTNGLSSVFASVFRSAAGSTLGSFSLIVSAVEGCPTPGPALASLATNVAASGILANVTNAACRFHYVPDPDDSTVRVSVAPSLGTQTLLVRRGAEPSASQFDCSAAASAASPAVCDLENLGDPVFVRVVRASGPGEFAITALGLSPCSLGGGDVALAAGVPASAALTSDENGACRFKLDVPALGGDAASFEVIPGDGAGDFDLYVRKGARPTASAFDCRSSTLDTAAESCLSILDAGTYYAMVQRVSGSGPFQVRADAVSSCSLGPAPSSLTKGVAASGSLLDAAGAKCFFAITPGSPLADPASPADDVLKLALSQDSEDNFDLYVRKGAVPSTSTRDCQSIQAAGIEDACQVVVGDGSTYYALVRRVSGGGDFSIVASSSSTCGLGPGYHELPNGVEVQSTTRAIAGSTKCYFALPSLARDDLLSIVQEAKTANTGYSLTVSRDVPIGSGPAACTGSSSWISIPSFGINLNTLAQCDILLEDGQPHLWFVSVSRTASAGANDIAFAIKGTAQQIPTLLPGVPQVGHVDTGSVQYWKVVLPENATFLDIQTAGDVSNLACAVGGQANSLVATACLLLPFPKLVGCAVAAGYGVSCDQAELTLAERCLEQTGSNETCAQIDAARSELCAAANAARNGTCVPSDTDGSVSGTCGIINRQTGDNTCDPLGASVKTTEMDLLVRHRAGLPKSSAYDCRSAGPGAVERCLFSDQVKEVHDNTTEPVRGDVNEQLANLTAIITGNRTALDQALADLKAAIAENRTTVIEPLWALVREVVFGLTGQDPGALPATPSVPAVPGVAAPVVPDQTNAYALPGPGKYFIAVRGPLDLASSLYYQGGDYAIVALHDDIQAPTPDDVKAQLDGVLANLDRSLEEHCARQVNQAAVCSALGAIAPALCEAFNATGQPCLVPELSVGVVEGVVCGVVQQGNASCPIPEHSVEGLCGALGELCILVDGVLTLVGEVVEGVTDALGGAPGGPPSPPGSLPGLPGGGPTITVEAWILGHHVKVL